MVVVEMIECDAVQLSGSRIGSLATIDARGTLEEKARIDQYCGQCQAAMPQKRKAPGFGKL